MCILLKLNFPYLKLLQSQSPSPSSIPQLKVPSFPISCVPSFIPQLAHPMLTRSKTALFRPKIPFSLLSSTASPITEPRSFTEANKISEWRVAMSEEFHALQAQGTRTLVPSSPMIHPIYCKWIYQIKRNSDGSVARYKARLVAQDNQHIAGLYYANFQPCCWTTYCEDCAILGSSSELGH